MTKIKPELELLIIFTRYPEAGKTKTRMIPALGAEGAATLQRQLTEITLETARTLAKERNLSLEVHFTGCSVDLCSSWLGADLGYYPQSEGDLGQKMDSAFKKGFERGITKIVLIGIDCPDITPEILAQAFDHLETHNLVLGSAVDGGYYLIGLQRPIPELFSNITWGSDTVLTKTIDIAEKLGLSYGLLPELRDLDRPEDLQYWSGIKTPDS